MEHFNELTPAETERLVLVMEEASEVVQACAKILRHGYESAHPSGGPTNRYDLCKELGHLDNATRMMFVAGDISEGHAIESARVKGETIGRYLHHQDENQ